MRLHDFQTGWLMRFASTLLMVLLISSGWQVHAQGMSFSDDMLIQRGTDAYNKYDYITAATYLYAYMQRNPSLMTDNPTFAVQVGNAYQDCINQLKQALRDRDKYRIQVQQLQQAQALNSGQSTAGLGVQPPHHAPLRIPPH